VATCHKVAQAAGRAQDPRQRVSEEVLGPLQFDYMDGSSELEECCSEEDQPPGMGALSLDPDSLFD
jgi:hypothetical protein